MIHLLCIYTPLWLLLRIPFLTLDTRSYKSPGGIAPCYSALCNYHHTGFQIGKHKMELRANKLKYLFFYVWAIAIRKSKGPTLDQTIANIGDRKSQFDFCCLIAQEVARSSI